MSYNKNSNYIRGLMSTLIAGSVVFTLTNCTMPAQYKTRAENRHPDLVEASSKLEMSLRAAKLAPCRDLASSDIARDLEAPVAGGQRIFANYLGDDMFSLYENGQAANKIIIDLIDELEQKWPMDMIVAQTYTQIPRELMPTRSTAGFFLQIIESDRNSIK